jgi:transcriptional regulator with XRE-family HTH domain
MIRQCGPSSTLAPSIAQRRSALCDYLRARREQVRPEDVGLVGGGRRRVTGLRREELAMLAGISAEYYLRLERGRAQNPSFQILDALARALQLDNKARRYLHQLVSPCITTHSDVETVADGLEELIDQFATPTILANRYQDVLAANPVARALSAGFTPGQNFLRWRLLDPAAKEFYVDWEEATAAAVSGLREVSGTDPCDPRTQSLVAELSSASERFREVWARADVGYGDGVCRMWHGEVGELQLYQHQLNVPHVPNCEGQHLLMYRAEPGSASARALEKLRSLPLPDNGIKALRRSSLATL